MRKRRPQPVRDGYAPIRNSFYYLLRFLDGRELKLYLAMKLQAWRKGGQQKGLVRVPTRRIARDIGMPHRTAFRTLKRLEAKRLARREGGRVYLLDPVHTTPRTTGHTTSVRSEAGAPVAPPGGGRSGTDQGSQWHHPGAAVAPRNKEMLEDLSTTQSDDLQTIPRRPRRALTQNSASARGLLEDDATLGSSQARVDGSARSSAARAEREDEEDMNRKEAIAAILETCGRAHAETRERLDATRAETARTEDQRRAFLKRQAEALLVAEASKAGQPTNGELKRGPKRRRRRIH